MDILKKIVSQVWFLLRAAWTSVRILFFLLGNRRAILKNRILFPFSCVSFGHNILQLELLTRYTYPHRASILYTPGKLYNPYLPMLYHRSVDIFYFHAPHDMGNFVWRVMRVALTCMTFFRMDTEKAVVYDYEGLCNLFSFGLKDIAGHEEFEKLYEIRNTRGFYHALTQNIGLKPQLPDDAIHKCRSSILRTYPNFFEKPVATLLLRMKGVEGIKLLDRERCANDMDTYVPAIEYLASEGFHIVGTGETDNAVFSKISGYYDFSKVDLDYKLLNMFLLTECDLFVGQQSGPYYLLNSKGVPCILTNCLPYRMGSLGQADINLYKKIKINGHELSPVDLYKDHIDLVRGYHFGQKNAEIIDNTAEELLETMIDGVAVFKKKPVPTEITAIDTKLKALMPDDIRAKHDPSRMPAFVLKSIADRLD